MFPNGGSPARLTGEFSKGGVVLSTGDTTLCGCISAYYSRSRPLKSQFLSSVGMLADGYTLVKSAKRPQYKMFDLAKEMRNEKNAITNTR